VCPVAPAVDAIGYLFGMAQAADSTSSVYDVPLTALDGRPLDPELLRGRVTLVVNVASECGYTPQYAGLQRLYEQYRERGLTVIGAPCNQFGGQEPGTADEIAEFCSANYGVTFPLYEKADVNGEDRQPLYAVLTETPDADGVAGDVAWNFEKFLVGTEGETIARLRNKVEPEDEVLVSAIESHLPG
jgi:glutathione peroxidase